jgi:hypothetical protein
VMTRDHVMATRAGTLVATAQVLVQLVVAVAVNPTPTLPTT